MYGVSVERYIRKYKYFMLCAALSSTIFAFLFKAPCSLFSYKIICTIHGPVSKRGLTAIKEFIIEQQKSRTLPLQIVHNLQETFPWIKGINLTIKPEFSLITVWIHRSFIYANNQWLITPTGTFLENYFYKDRYNKSMPCVTINENELSNQKSMSALYDYIQKLPTDVFNFYTLHWKNIHTIYLVDSHEKNFKLVTSIKNVITHQQLYKGMNIKGILHKNNFFKKKTDCWIADLRFSNHIIVAKEGSNYGSKLS